MHARPRTPSKPEKRHGHTEPTHNYQRKPLFRFHLISILLRHDLQDAITHPRNCQPSPHNLRDGATVSATTPSPFINGTAASMPCISRNPITIPIFLANPHVTVSTKKPILPACWAGMRPYSSDSGAKTGGLVPKPSTKTVTVSVPRVEFMQWNSRSSSGIPDAKIELESAQRNTMDETRVISIQW
jgi:hypothetical protein